MDVKIDAARHAMDGLNKKIEAAVRVAWADDMDFMHGPMTLDGPDPFDTAWDITRSVQHEVSVKGGPIERGRPDIPIGWTVYRCPFETEGERVRFAAGRSDWREKDWQDCCMVPGPHCPCDLRTQPRQRDQL